MGLTKRIDSDLSKRTNVVLAAVVAGLCVLSLATGCRQQRYKPSSWRSGSSQSSLPGGNEGRSQFSDQSSQSLPYRDGAQSLPMRSGTLPLRNGTSLPERQGASGRQWNGTLPGRTEPGIVPDHLLPRQNWNWENIPVVERALRQGIRGGSTLPD